MNLEFKLWLEQQTFTMNLRGGWRVIEKEHNTFWKWDWTRIKPKKI
jgi:hypothetical protein